MFFKGIKFKILALSVLIIIATITLYINSVKKINENTIICESAKVTGAEWLLIGDSKGYYSEHMQEYIQIEGNVPKKEQSQDFMLLDRYIFQGKFVNNKDVLGESYRNFSVSKWEKLNLFDRMFLRVHFLIKSIL